ncbi:MAG TPA: CehA/McbA family metallohydrolase, partial [Gemmataceae bacterium]|nr:CehA/McbA family metallohydrolase [Gemmataceae bacterium]
TWTTPLMRWAKAQGAITGYAHSANGLQIDPVAASKRMLADLDKNGDRELSPAEAKAGLLPEPFEKIDANGDGLLSLAELEAAHRRAATRLPNLAIPELNGIGAQEIFVTTSQGLCDFISAMDTARIPEWNCWYHIMNCGFPLKVSGETDFPCISGSRVGQGRVYVQLGKVDRVEFADWAIGLARGHSYVSDGYAHALAFAVDGKSAGETLELAKGGMVKVSAKVAFAAQMPLGTSVGAGLPTGPRHVELIVNGNVVATKDVPADDRVHDIDFSVPIERSSWVALRHFPQMHTNPVTVRVAGQPIRASRESALWCAGCIEQLWRARSNAIRADEREAAHAKFLEAIDVYRKIAAEAR